MIYIPNPQRLRATFLEKMPRRIAEGFARSPRKDIDVYGNEQRKNPIERIETKNKRETAMDTCIYIYISACPSGLTGIALDQTRANKNDYVAMKSVILYVRR